MTNIDIESEYQDTIEWLYNLHLFGIKFGLKKIEKLLYYLGNPERKLKIVHVGGTNGKGSVSSMLSSILIQAGYDVGLNTSPHLSEFTERITINGKQITKEKVIEYAKLLKDIREKVNAETDLGYATYFEVVTAIALKYFYDSGVDYVILEVGLGGIYDATNVVDPILSVITDISLDHMEHLGNTLTSVAENKAGIIKNGRPLVTSNTNDEVLDVLLSTCKKNKCRCYRFKQDFDFKLNSFGSFGVDIDYIGINKNLIGLKIPLLGEHQGRNSALALAAMEVFMEHEKLQIIEQDIITGIHNTLWPGRLEVVQDTPLVLLDGAHNPAGAKVLADAIKIFDYDNLFLVFGCSEEKDIFHLLEPLLPLVDRLYITQANIRRAAEPTMIEETLRGIDLDRRVVTPVQAAIKQAISDAQKSDMVCICGSLFIVGESRELWFKNSDSDSAPSKSSFRIHY